MNRLGKFVTQQVRLKPRPNSRWIHVIFLKVFFFYQFLFCFIFWVNSYLYISKREREIVLCLPTRRALTMIPLCICYSAIMPRYGRDQFCPFFLWNLPSKSTKVGPLILCAIRPSTLSQIKAHLVRMFKQQFSVFLETRVGEKVCKNACNII